ncbi:MAG: substrate-binding domain-containing protein [archaeon GB-1867-005]|nr:substrate-binding domain-containing protein [Candidatus Culexmicrobium cathedralense]
MIELNSKHLIYIAMALVLIIASVVLYNSLTPHEITLRISTTTSLYATGLLEYLAEKFEEKHPDVIIQFIPVGSGEALRRAAKGDVDMVFVHAPLLEIKYINDSTLINGNIVAYNYFIIVGPHEDPAGIKGLDPIEAFKKIYKAGEEGSAVFVSRGDNSGTHVRELYIWKLANLSPHGNEWYVESGSGMSETLLIANELRAYTLSDIGTYLKLRTDGRIDLEPLVSKDDLLINIYSVYIVNPCKFRGVNYEVAKMFKDFVTSDEGQKLIGSYGVSTYGQSLFLPAKDKYGELEMIWVELSKS